jgi:hypothetical protein
LGLTAEIMMEKLLEYNMCVSKELNDHIDWDRYESDAERDDYSIDEDELENNICYRITGLMYPKIDKDELITTMLQLGIRNFDF